jgi:hypothetical protein
MSLGFWWELHWTCRLLLVGQPFLLCWFCQSMSTGDLSSSVVFSELFLQWFVILLVEVIYILLLSLLNISWTFIYSFVFILLSAYVKCLQLLLSTSGIWVARGMQPGATDLLRPLKLGMLLDEEQCLSSSSSFSGIPKLVLWDRAKGMKLAFLLFLWTGRGILPCEAWKIKFWMCRNSFSERLEKLK